MTKTFLVTIAAPFASVVTATAQNMDAESTIQHEALGCGYVQYSERVKIMDNHYRVRVVKGTEGGLGLYWRLGAEYHIGKHFGIGAQVTSLSAFYSEPADIQIPDDEAYGIKRINILIGPRVYF